MSAPSEVTAENVTDQLAATSTTVRVPRRVVLVVALAIVLAGVSLWMAYP